MIYLTSTTFEVKVKVQHLNAVARHSSEHSSDKNPTKYAISRAIPVSHMFEPPNIYSTV